MCVCVCVCAVLGLDDKVLLGLDDKLVRLKAANATLFEHTNCNDVGVFFPSLRLLLTYWFLFHCLIINIDMWFAACPRILRSWHLGKLIGI